MPEPAPPLRALLVGIDCYPEPPAGGFAYHSLYGAVADVARVEEYLCGTLGVGAESVSRLVAPHVGGDGERRPTHANLIAAFGELERSCRPGDHALVYYSGHGGRVPTLVPLVKGAHGLDEVLAPADVGDPAVPYLRDVEIGAWLARMASRGVFVTLLLDCCHSGGAVRRDRRVRGHDGVDRTPRPQDFLLASREEIAAIGRRASGGRADQRLEVVPASAQTPAGWALVAACRPQERAVEVEIGGDWCGVMTYHLLAALRRAGEPLTYRRLHAILTARLHAAGFSGQTPVVDGEADRLLFGRERLPARHGVEVLEVEGWPGERVRLATGSLHGTRHGERYALVATAGDDGRSERLAEAKIAEVGSNVSWAVPGPRLRGARAVRAGDTAMLVDPGPLALRRSVAWSGPCSASAGGAEERDGRLASLLAEHADAFLVAAEPGAAGDFEVAEIGGLLEIRDAGGNPIPHLGPPLAGDAPDTLNELMRRLGHLARWGNIRALENPDRTSPLAGTLRLRLERLADPDPAAGTGRGEPRLTGSLETSHAAGSLAAIPVGSRLLLILTNAGTAALNVAVLDLQPDWGIQQIVPPRDGAPWMTLEPGCSTEVELAAYLPDGFAEGGDVLKAVAALGAFDLASLELPALAAPPGAMRRAHRSRSVSADDSFGRLLAALGARRAPERVLRCGDMAPERWTTAEVEVRVTARPSRAHACESDESNDGGRAASRRSVPLTFERRPLR